MPVLDCIACAGIDEDTDAAVSATVVDIASSNVVGCLTTLDVLCSDPRQVCTPLPHVHCQEGFGA